MKSLILISTLLFALPSVALAHASPVEYWPASSATVTEAPTEVRIRFSERAEEGASRIVIKNGNGEEIQQGRAVISVEDSHVLSIPVSAGEKGAYVVTWSVVSSDDGHFTKGGFTYFIGDTASAGSLSAPQVEVVQLSALPEASLIAIELAGNSLLLGMLVLFACIIRPRVSSMEERASRSALRVHSLLVYAGIALALLGALAQIVLKSSELATLQGIGMVAALPLYLSTVAGSATVIRAVCIVVFAIIYMARRSAIVRSLRLTWSEALLVACLLVFAYFRATVSHATANPFHPEIGIAVNFFHLLVKDLSAGLLVGLSLLMLAKPLRTYMGGMLRSVMQVSALLLALVGPTAAYIVWLHLKDPANLSSSLWGERFVLLLISALISVAFLTYHVIGSLRMPQVVARFLPYTIPAEAVAGLAIVFFSSLMIITSPPMEARPFSYTAQSNDVVITLSRAPHEDGMALLTFTRAHEAFATPPTVLLDADAEGGIVLAPDIRFPGGYVLPVALFAGDEPHTLTVSSAQENGYDAHTVFTVRASDFKVPPEGERGFDMFALLMIALAFASVVYAIVLFRLARKGSGETPEQGTLARLGIAVVLALLVGSQIGGLGSMLFGNSFKRVCVADGNSWHLMLPTRDGRTVSSVPSEGCMALGGAFHITDAREYQFLKAPGASSVTFTSDLEGLTAGRKENLAFTITNEDGTPARLSVQHERLVHVIIVSKDMTEFSHVHPDDAAPFTAEQIADASFTVPFTFPKAGEYIIGIDYASGLSARSEQFLVTVGGVPAQQEKTALYPLRGTFDGYEVSLQAGFPIAGQPATLIWRVQKDGKDVLDLEPYLAAAMHVALVKDDLTEFVHAHGEVHVPGAPIPKVTATTVHNHAPPPPSFGPLIEAHTLFPTAGDYTVFAQFAHDGKVITAPFSVRVE